MMIPRLRPESSRSGLLGLPGLLIGGVLLAQFVGCSQGPPPAPGSSVELTAQQASRVQSVLNQVAEDAPRDPKVTLDLYPSDGIRWETLEDAVNHAVEVPSLEMSVTETKTVSDHEQVFYLVDSNSWPARITVRGSGDPMQIQVEAVMGPIPSEPASLRKSKELESRVLAAIAQYARVPRLAPYEVHTSDAGSELQASP